MRRAVKVYVIRRKSSPYFYLRWEERPGIWREKSTKKKVRRNAERDAIELERKLSVGQEVEDLDWDEFRWRYEREHIPSLCPSSAKVWNASAKLLEELVHPRELVDVDAAMLSRFAAKMREEKRPETTMATYLRTVRAAMGWAHQMGFVETIPRFPRIKQGKGRRKHMRSRPVTVREMGRLLRAARIERPNDHDRWRRFLKGLWHSGLRVGELLTLSWDETSDLAVDTSFQIPMLRIAAEGEKAGKDRFQPITPEFWKLIEQGERSGLVFPLAPDGKQLANNTVIRIISDIGKRAKVVTDVKSQKYATSHDIGRRALSTRLAGRLTQSELAEWMRHASPSTTQQYYTLLDAQKLAEKVWPKGGAA